MRIAVGGSRSINDWDLVYKVITEACAHHGWELDELIHGGADGVDLIADAYARSTGIALTIMPVTPKEWVRFGPKRGPQRNKRMINYAHAYIGIWDGTSPGTASAISYVKRIKKPHHIYTLGE